MGYHPVLGFGIEGGARWQRLRNLLGGKLRLECVCVMPVVCVYSWSLWSVSLLGPGCRDSVPGSAAPLPPCPLLSHRASAAG